MNEFIKKNRILLGLSVLLLIAAVILVIIVVKNSSLKDEKGKSENNELVVSDSEKQDISENSGLSESQILDITEKSYSSNQIDASLSVTDDTEYRDSINISDDEMMGENEEESEPELKVFDINVVLGDYHSVKSDINPVKISDEDVQARIEKNLAREAQIIDMDTRPLHNGDMVVVTYKCTDNNLVVDELCVTCYQAILGYDMLIKEIEEQIIGKQRGDAFETDMILASLGESAPEYASKKLHFSIEIVDSFEVYIPELTDDFIKTVTGYDSLSEYRKYLKNTLQKNEDLKAYAEKSEDVLRKVISISTFSGEIDDAIDYMYNSELTELNEQCLEEYLVDAESYYFMYEEEEPEAFHKRLREEAEYSVKSQEVLKAVAVQENLDVSQEEFDAKFNEIFFETYGFASKEAVQSKISEENINYIVNSAVLEDKAKNILMSITD